MTQPFQLAHVSDLLKRRQPVNVVLYGDSISEVGRTPGYFGGATAAEKNWGALLVNLLNERFGAGQFVVKHFAIGGQNAYEGLGRFDYIAPLKPDLVLVEFGANDCAWHPLPPQSTRLAVGAMIDASRALHGAEVAVICPGGDNPRKSFLTHLTETIDALRGVAAEKNAPFVDVRAAVLAATRNGEAWADFHNGEADCHPNDAGHAVWARSVFDVLVPLIQP